MQRLLLTTALVAFASAAQAQLFTGGATFTITTQNSPAAGGPNSVPFDIGVPQLLDGGALSVVINVVNAVDFATTGSQWLVFSYSTPDFSALSSGGQNWSIEQVGIPLAQNANFIADFTSWTTDGQPLAQVGAIFGQTIGSNPVPGSNGNGEGTSGFVDPIAAGPAPQLGAFADPFNIVVNGLGGNIPTGFNQALEFEPASFVPPATGVPEPSTWAMLGLGFAFLGWVAMRKKKESFSAL